VNPLTGDIFTVADGNGMFDVNPNADDIFIIAGGNGMFDVNPNADDIFIIAGGNGMFDVNPITGGIFIVGRQMFTDKATFSLAVSAQAYGAVNTTSTPAQIVNIQVGYRPPQPYFDPYNVTFYENSTAMSV